MPVVLWLAFPNRDLTQRLSQAERSDSLTIAYLHAWLAAKPDNWPIYMTLARHNLLIGRPDDALQILDAMKAPPDWPRRDEAVRLRMQTLEQAAWSFAPGSVRRAELLEQVATELQRQVGATNDPRELAGLLERAQSLDRPILARQVLVRLVQLSGSSADPGTLHDLARRAMSLGDPALAAQCHWLAFEASGSIPARRNALLAAAKSFQAADRVGEFLDRLSQRLDRIPAERELHAILVRLALQAGRHELAERLAREMLKIALREQWRLLLATDGSGAANDERTPDVASAMAEAFADARPMNVAMRTHAAGPRAPAVPSARANRPALPAPTGRPARAPARTVEDHHATQVARLRDQAGASLASPRSRILSPAQSAAASGRATVALGRPSPTAAALPAWNARLAHATAGRPNDARRSVAGVRQLSAPRLTTLAKPAPAARLLPVVLPKSKSGAHIPSSVPHPSQAPRPPVPPAGPDGPRTAPAMARAAPTTPPASARPSPTTTTAASVVPDDPVAAAGRGRAAFDDDTYKLAYDVFVANSNLADALRVAESAVRQTGSDAPWRRRVAQVAEWLGRPKIALAQWQWIARNTHEPNAWPEVRRLALAGADQDALLEVLQWEARRPGSDPALDLQVAESLERSGRTEQAFAWINERVATRGEAQSGPLIAHLLGLAERTGDDSRVLALLQSMQRQQGPDPARAVRLAKLLYDRRQFVDAFEALRSASAAATPIDRFSADDERRHGFWSLYGALARVLQNEDEALVGHRQLLMRDVVSREHLDSLAGLLEQRSPSAALDVTEYAWRRWQLPQSLERAFALAVETGDYRRAQSLLEGLSAADRKRFDEDPGLSRLRAQFLHASGDLAGARREWQRLLVREPDDADLQAALIWVAIAERDAEGLRGMLQRWSARATETPALWGPFGAGWQALDEPQRALVYFHRQARRSNDYLWWLAYADALGQVGYVDAAWSLRRRAWTEVSRQAASTRLRGQATREQTVALAMTFAPGDRSRALLARLVQDRLPPAATPEPADASRPVTGDTAPVATNSADLTRIVTAVLNGGTNDPAAPPAPTLAQDTTPEGTPMGLAGPLGGPGLLQVIERTLEASQQAVTQTLAENAPGLGTTPAAYLPSGAVRALPPDRRSDPAAAGWRKPDGPDAVTESPARRSADAGAGDGQAPARSRAERELEAATARELALAYLISGESFDAARGWLLSRYANDLARPTWARLTVALADRDRTALGNLLDTLPDWLPKVQSVEAMQQTQRLAAAQTLAFDTLDVRPASNDAHQKLMETIASEASNVAGEASGGVHGPLSYHRQRLDVSWRQGERWTLGAIAEAARWTSDDAEVIATPGTTDRTFGAWVRMHDGSGWWTATATHRDALRPVNGLRLDWQQSSDRRWRSGATLGLHQPAVELAALRVGAVRDLIEARSTFAFSQRDYAGAVLGATRLRTQSGAALADGLSYNLEAGHRFKLDYPDLTVKASLGRSQYRSASDAVDRNDPVVAQLTPAAVVDPAGLFVPRSFSEASIAVAVGDMARHTPAKALRGFAEAGLRRNSLTGVGWHVRAGATGAVLGADRLTLSFGAISATPGTPRGSRDLSLSYQWLF